MEVLGGITTLTEALTLNGTGIGGAGALRNVSGNNDFAGLVTLGSASRIQSDAGRLTLSHTGTITGATFGLTIGGAGDTVIRSSIGTTTGSLSKEGSGKLTLSGVNTYSGTTSITGGSLLLGSSTALPGSAAMSLSGKLETPSQKGRYQGGEAFHIAALTIATILQRRLCYQLWPT